MKLALTAFVAVAVFAGWQTALAGGSARVSVSPVAINAQSNSSVAFDVTIGDVPSDPGLGGYDLTLHVNPAIIRIDSLTDSGFVQSGDNIVICGPAEIDNVAGQARAACTAIPLFGAPGVSATSDVALLHASVTTIGNGTSPVTLSGGLAGPSGTPVGAVFTDGAITVAGAASASATALPASATALPSATTSASIPSVVPESTAAVQVSNTARPEASATPGVSVLRAPATGAGEAGGGGGRPVAAIVIVGLVGGTSLVLLLLGGRHLLRS